MLEKQDSKYSIYPACDNFSVYFKSTLGLGWQTGGEEEGATKLWSVQFVVTLLFSYRRTTAQCAVWAILLYCVCTARAATFLCISSACRRGKNTPPLLLPLTSYLLPAMCPCAHVWHFCTSAFHLNMILKREESLRDMIQRHQDYQRRFCDVNQSVRYHSQDTFFHITSPKHDFLQKLFLWRKEVSSFWHLVP